MALRLDPRRRKVLDELMRAGPDGLPAWAVPEAPVFVDHCLGEFFIDPLRIDPDRVRLTWIGRAYAPLYHQNGVSKCLTTST